jgi:hypothetical protein
VLLSIMAWICILYKAHLWCTFIFG